MSRLNLIRNRLDGLEIDGLLIGSQSNRRYISGFTGTTGWLIISAHIAIIVVDFRYVEQADRECREFSVKLANSAIEEWLPSLLIENNITKLGVESEHVPLDVYLRLVQSFQNATHSITIVPTRMVIETLRCIKEEIELAQIIEASLIADRAMDYAATLLPQNLTEKQVALEIEMFIQKNGSDHVPFDVIVASGPNSALPHARPENRKISPNEPVVIDLGAQVNGYCSDMTRTFIIDKENETFSKLYNIVLGAQLASLSIINSSMTAGQIDSIARDIINNAGYGDQFGHGLGHGVGLDIHELPGIRRQSTDVLSDGMVFTIEPGVYIPGWGGIRIEDTVSFVNGKLKQLTNCNKNALIHGG